MNSKFSIVLGACLLFSKYAYSMNTLSPQKITNGCQVVSRDFDIAYSLVELTLDRVTIHKMDSDIQKEFPPFMVLYKKISGSDIDDEIAGMDIDVLVDGEDTKNEIKEFISGRPFEVVAVVSYSRQIGWNYELKKLANSPIGIIHFKYSNSNVFKRAFFPLDQTYPDIFKSISFIGCSSYPD